MIIVPSAYLAPVSYYALLLAHGREVCIEQWEYYVKQTLRNRAYIATEAGRMALTLPVEHNGGKKQLMRDVRISDHGNWRHLHWQALKAAYDSSPFFEFYADEFAHFYEGKPTVFLQDFCLQLQQLVCELLNLDYEPQLTDTYLPEGDFLDLRSEPDYKPAVSSVPYYQVFASRHGFMADLSIADLLFNMGPEGLLVLRDMTKQA